MSSSWFLSIYLFPFQPLKPWVIALISFQPSPQSFWWEGKCIYMQRTASARTHDSPAVGRNHWALREGSVSSHGHELRAPRVPGTIAISLKSRLLCVTLKDEASQIILHFKNSPLIPENILWCDAVSYLSLSIPLYPWEPRLVIWKLLNILYPLSDCSHHILVWVIPAFTDTSLLQPLQRQLYFLSYSAWTLGLEGEQMTSYPFSLPTNLPFLLLKP